MVFYIWGPVWWPDLVQVTLRGLFLGETRSDYLYAGSFG